MSHDVLWTPEKQRESAIPLSPLMQRLEELERKVKRLEAHRHDVQGAVYAEGDE
jgi:hypothetical protein